ncbi:MAG TPA: hypothetical protein VK484_11545 [Ferruginibacter sp.]|nr:hypothetical protein [Ferruginibacter sp.]
MVTKKKAGSGRPVRTDKDNKTVSSVEKGTKPGEKRKAYIVNSELAGKIDAIAYWDRVNIKDVVHEAFTDRVTKYEKKNGSVKPVKK